MALKRLNLSGIDTCYPTFNPHSSDEPLNCIAVCTKNLNLNVMVMKSAKDRVT
jgi:hypothetical protein